MAGGLLVGGRYRLHSIIGQGGMGVVWRALDVNLDRDVAVKILRTDLLESTLARRRVEREARLSGRVASPHVVSLFDVGEHENKTPYLVFELLRGETLKARMERTGTFPWQAVVDVGRQIAIALAAAHGEAVVHRDLKPSNVMFIGDGVLDDFVKVLDFGIARPISRSSDDVTSTDDRLLGSPAYVAPELVDGRELSVGTDLYALGVILYEMQTGTNPFRTDTAIKTLMRHVDTVAPRVADVPDSLATLIECLLEKQPSKRPADARVVVDALKEIALGRSVDARALSAERRAAERGPETPSPAPPVGRARVLIVDDDENYRELTRQRLEREGFVVGMCNGPYGVLHEIRSGEYKVVVLDVNMPGLQGTKIMDMLESDGPRPRVLFASSIDESELAALARRHKADGYIYKGAPRDELVSRIERVLT